MNAAGDLSSSLSLARDFAGSRLPRFESMPGRNAPRSALVSGFDVHYRFDRGEVQSTREVLVEDACRLPFDVRGVRAAIDSGVAIGLWKR